MYFGGYPRWLKGGRRVIFTDTKDSRVYLVDAGSRKVHQIAGPSARKSRLVELRYFGGLTLGEAADLLGISLETAKRDWRMAKAGYLAR